MNVDEDCVSIRAIEGGWCIARKGPLACCGGKKRPDVRLGQAWTERFYSRDEAAGTAEVACTQATDLTLMMWHVH